MSHQSKRRWFQFSLKTMLCLSMFSGVMVSWFSLACRQYNAEQRLIASIASDLPSSMMMTVSTNGQQTYPGGIRVL